MFWSTFMPCASCGEAISQASADSHACDPERRVEFQMLAMRHQVLDFDGEFRDYLSGHEGRFEMWLAARDVRRPA